MAVLPRGTREILFCSNNRGRISTAFLVKDNSVFNSGHSVVRIVRLHAPVTHSTALCFAASTLLLPLCLLTLLTFLVNSLCSLFCVKVLIDEISVHVVNAFNRNNRDCYRYQKHALKFVSASLLQNSTFSITGRLLSYLLPIVLDQSTEFRSEKTGFSGSFPWGGGKLYQKAKFVTILKMIT